MDFNTGTGGTGGSGGSGGGPGGGPTGPSGPRPGTAAATGGEFNYRDPVQSFVATVRGLATAPVAFFAAMRRQGDLINPLLFAIICWEVAALLGGILGIFGSVIGLGTRTVGESLGGFVVSLIVTPIFAAIVIFIGAGILHLLTILIIKPVGTGFETTLRAVSYSWVAQLVYWIPLVGWIIGGVVWTILAIFGIREGHGTTTGKAALVVLIPVAVAAFLGIVLAIVVGAFIFSVLSSQ